LDLVIVSVVLQAEGQYMVNVVSAMLSVNMAAHFGSA
jgi:hypothetical protein